MARAARASAIRFEDRTFASTLGELPWGLVLMLITVACIGTAALYSSTFTNPTEAALPARHAVRFVISLGIMFVIALVPLGIWLRAGDEDTHLSRGQRKIRARSVPAIPARPNVPDFPDHQEHLTCARA